MVNRAIDVLVSRGDAPEEGGKLAVEQVLRDITQFQDDQPLARAESGRVPYQPVLMLFPADEPVEPECLSKNSTPARRISGSCTP